MKLPNLLIIGAQKCGTTWLHHSLNKSHHFWGSNPKELNFWNKRIPNIMEYNRFFEDAPDAVDFVYESTPHYFQLPRNNLDIAKNIRVNLGDIPLLLMLRNPIERYLSAYTHHMMQGRVPEAKIIESTSNDYGMLDLGNYASILAHFSSYFSKINAYFYDDLGADPNMVAEKVFRDLGVDYDLLPEDLDFRTNDKIIKNKRLLNSGKGFSSLPELSEKASQELRDYYRSEVIQLSQLTGRDLNGWLF